MTMETSTSFVRNIVMGEGADLRRRGMRPAMRRAVFARIALWPFLCLPLSFANSATAASTSLNASGGDVTFVNNGLEAVHTYASAGTFTFMLSTAQTVRLLLVGGGGGGGYDCSGGGGGGGMIDVADVPLAAGAYTVTVGAGGSGGAGNGQRGGNGGETILAAPDGAELYRAFGGGGGGAYSSNRSGLPGGCGGGATTGGAGGTGVDGQGHGAGTAGTTCTTGGGGAGGPSPDNNVGKEAGGGAGGPGRASDISGTQVFYGGGGGGGGWNCKDIYKQMNGGLGGGGNGARNLPIDTRQATTLPDGRNEYEAECGVNGLGGGGGGANNTDFNGRPGGCGTLVIRLSNLSSDSPEPSVVYSGQTALEHTSAGLVATLTAAGYGYGNNPVSLSVQYATSPDAFEVEPFAGTVAKLTDDFSGTMTNTLASLEPETLYYGRLVAVNAGGYRGVSAVFAFSTKELEGEKYAAASGTDARPGLWQRRIASSNFATVTAVEFTEPAVEDVVMPGTVMAAVTSRDNAASFWALNGTNGKAYIDASGTSWTFPSATSYLYDGWMLMEKGVTYNFFENMMDGCLLRIDGETILTDGDYKRCASAAYVCGASGWHHVAVYLVGDGGGCGNNDNWPFSFGFNRNGPGNATYANDGDNGTSYTATPLNIESWSMFMNTADDVFLYTAIPARHVEIESAALEAANAEATFTVSLSSVPAALAASELHAVWGARNCGTASNLWENSRLVATCDGTAQSRTVMIGDLPDGVTHFRFYARGADGSVGWSDAVSLDIGGISLGAVSADGTGGDEIVVSGSVLSFPGETCSLTVYTGTSADNLHQAWTGLAGSTLATAGDFTLTLRESDTAAARYIEPGSTVLVAVEASSGGKSARTEPVAVHTGGAPQFGVVTATVNGLTLSVNGSIADAGAGATAQVTLYTGDTSDEGALEAAGTPASIMGSGPCAFRHDFPAVGETYYWQLRAVATTASGATLETRTEVRPATTKDETTYVWKPEEGNWSGDWSDPAHWAPDKTPNLGYPRTADAIASFENCTTNNPVVVNVDGKYEVNILRWQGADASDVTFAGAGVSESSLSCKIYNHSSNDRVRSNSRVEFRDMTLTRKGDWEILRDHPEVTNVTVRLSNVKSTGAYFSLCSPACLFEFANGSDVTTTKINVGGTNTVFVLDDSIARINTGGFHVNADIAKTSAGDVDVFIRGKNAQFTGTKFYIYRTHNSDYNMNVHLEVPVGGYANTPINISNDLGGSAVAADKGKICFIVEENSPALRKSKDELTDHCIVTATTLNKYAVADGIGTLPVHDYGSGEEACGAFKFDDTASPKKILLDLQGFGAVRGTMILVR